MHDCEFDHTQGEPLMPIPSASRGRQVLVAVAFVLSVGVLAGCADSESSSGAVATTTGTGSFVDEVAAHDGRVCPRQLPHSEDADDQGFGTFQPAESTPSLPAPEKAWVCQYQPTETGPAPDGDRPSLTWVRYGEAHPVDSSQLPALQQSLNDLAPADEGQACNDDLGSRWMLAYSHSKDLTGVVVDDYGCQDIRLTDEPFTTVPGEATQSGTVPGVLTGPLLNELKTASAG